MARDRGADMAARVERAVNRAGLEDHAMRLAGLFRTILEKRSTILRNPEHPDYLHPGRTLLVLLEDLRVTDADVLAAALIVDSERPGLGPSGDEAMQLAGARPAAIAAPIPAASAEFETRLETLLCLEPESLLVALAERLDHARHLHLRPPETFAAFHASIGSADLPASSRSHPRLAWRLQWWYDSFARRFLR